MPCPRPGRSACYRRCTGRSVPCRAVLCRAATRLASGAVERVAGLGDDDVVFALGDGGSVGGEQNHPLVGSSCPVLADSAVALGHERGESEGGGRSVRRKSPAQRVMVGDTLPRVGWGEF